MTKTPPNIPKNTYTYAPQQHPNLILGSLHLLFWLVFRPLAWKNYIIRLTPFLSLIPPLVGDVSLPKLFGNQKWWGNWGRQSYQELQIWRFILQGFILLPLLVSLLMGLACLSIGTVKSVALGVAGGVFLGVLGGSILGVTLNVAGGVVLGVTLSAMGVLLLSTTLNVAGVEGNVVLSTALNVADNVVLCSALSSLASLALGMALGVLFDVEIGVAVGAMLGVAGGMVLGITLGVALSMVLGVALGVLGVTALGLALGVTSGVTLGLASGVTLGLASGVTLGLASGVTLGLASGVTLGLAWDIVSGLLGGITVGTLGIARCVHRWRPALLAILLIPWHFGLYQIDKIRGEHTFSLLHRHLAFWDEWQVLPIQRLEQHLLLVLEQNPTEGQAALAYLSKGHQRWAAQAAQIELDARQLERCGNAIAVSQIHHNLNISELEEPAAPLLRNFKRISADVNAALNQNSTYNQKLALNAVRDGLDGLLEELTYRSDKYAVRFRSITEHWSNIVTLELNTLTKAIELSQEIDSPYIIGVPLTEQQEIFVGRVGMSARIEQLLMDHRRPPLLLYGQRRTGKTSLLNNLGRLLPKSIVPLFVDLQGPVSNASNHQGFLSNLAKGMVGSAKRQRNFTFPNSPYKTLKENYLISPEQPDYIDPDPFTSFDEWLDKVENALEENTALLALDEFEALDQALIEGRFSETAVLGMLRNLIQHRPRFKVLLSGSHTLEEFQRWSSYLINAQVLHLGYLKESEARQLIEHPVKDFALRYEPDASQRVLDLTCGHPFLVQLLCAEIVVLKNEQDPSVRRLATLADVEAAIPEALSSGSMFFSDIERNQIDPPTLAVLRYLAAQGEGAAVSQPSVEQAFPEGVEEALQQLLRRELIETTPEGYRIQVELIRRWFHQ